MSSDYAINFGVSAAPLKHKMLVDPSKNCHILPHSRSISAAHAARREAIDASHAALKVPAPFANATEFMFMIRGLVNSMPPGATRRIADLCQVSTSTASKWLTGKKIPCQPNLDKIIEWWMAHRDDLPVSIQTPTLPRVAAHVSLRLPPAISARLKRAARFRNVDAMTYAAQILDRHLPSMESMQ